MGVAAEGLDRVLLLDQKREVEEILHRLHEAVRDESVRQLVCQSGRQSMRQSNSHVNEGNEVMSRYQPNTCGEKMGKSINQSTNQSFSLFYLPPPTCTGSAQSTSELSRSKVVASPSGRSSSGPLPPCFFFEEEEEEEEAA